MTQILLGYVIYDRVTDSRSVTLFSLQSPLSGRDKKQIRGGYIDLQRKGVGVGEEETIIFSFSRSALALALARLLRSRARRSFRRERKEK